MPDFDQAERGAVFHPEDLDEILEKLRSGDIGINQSGENTAEPPLTEDADAAADTANTASSGSTEDAGEETGKHRRKSRKGSKKKDDEENDLADNHNIDSNGNFCGMPKDIKTGYR